jgi:hypothetical protein
MVGEKPDYLAYLLRLWSTSGEEGVVWRASLRSPHTGELRGFANLDELFDHLRQRTREASDADGGPAAEAARATLGK